MQSHEELAAGRINSLFRSQHFLPIFYETTGHSAILNDNIAVRIISLHDASLGHLAITGMKLPTDSIAISITVLGHGSTVHLHLADIPNKSPSGQVTF